MSSQFCSVSGCPRKRHARGWCSVHYSQWKRHGLEPFQWVRPTEMERFWQLFHRDPVSGCWVWTGSLMRGNYAQFQWVNRGGAREGRAYRFVYERLVGPIPDGLSIDHLCRNTLCVNPAHLEPVTMAENLARTRREMCEKGLHPLSGVNEFKTKLSRRCRECHREHMRARHTGEKGLHECPECGRMIAKWKSGRFYAHVCEAAA